MREYFKFQCDYYPTLTQDVIDRVEFKTVWSGKRMGVGDKVVYAFVYQPNTDDLKSLLSSKGAVETDVQVAEDGWWFGTYDNENEQLYKNNQVAL